MATTTARYYYCDNGTLDFLDVTMVDGNCGNMINYSDTYCSYNVYRKTITFTLSKSIPVTLNVRYQYLYTQEENYVEVFSNYVQKSLNIPAGVITHTITVDCKEERWCSSGEDGSIRYEQLQ